jgi:glutaredoxin
VSGTGSRSEARRPGLGERLRNLLLGTPVRRSPEQQRAVDAACRELTLYHYPSCPYCLVVRRALRRGALNVRSLNVHGDPQAAAELVARGGKAQVPCLRIAPAQGGERWLYESADIVRYLRERFPALPS